MTQEIRLTGPVVIVQTPTDPGDLGEPRIVYADDETIVFVPSFDLWPDSKHVHPSRNALCVCGERHGASG